MESDDKFGDEFDDEFRVLSKDDKVFYLKKFMN